MALDNKDDNPLEYTTFETVLGRLTLKDKKMYKHITKAGEKFQKAMFKYYETWNKSQKHTITQNYSDCGKEREVN